MHARNPWSNHLPLVLLVLSLSGCEIQDELVTPLSTNSAPVARIAWVSGETVGQDVLLDGSESYDVDGHDLLWHWDFAQVPVGSELDPMAFVPNGNRSSSETRFVPDVPGSWTVGLQIEDELGRRSEHSWLILQIGEDGLSPLASAGSDRYAIEGDLLCLDGGESSDPMGLELGFHWELVTRPELSALDTAALIGADQQEVCFTPDAPGSFMLSLIVDNGVQQSEPDYVLVTVGSTNQAPIADIKVLASSSCDTVVLDGTASDDADGDELHYSWHMLLVPVGSEVPTGDGAFEDPHAPHASFYADLPGEYYVQLVVDDGKTWSEPLMEVLTLEPKEANEPPFVGHSPDAVLVDTPFMGCMYDCADWELVLEASDSWDPEGDPIRVTWEVLSGDAVLAAPEGVEVSLLVDGPPGDCGGQGQTNVVEVAVTATDCSGDSDTSIVTAVYHCGLP